MLDKFISQKFIEKIKAYTQYNFIIMNRDGIIIAATETERIGDFHQASFLMMESGLERIVVNPDEEYFGVKYGIDMPIIFNNETIGSIGITGIPNEVKDIVVVVKMSFETMLEYAKYKEEINQNKTEKDKFFSRILNWEYKEKDELLTLAKRLNYLDNIPRIPILIKLKDNHNLGKVIIKIQEHSLYDDQDISFVGKEEEIIIFKSIFEKNENLFMKYREFLGDYMKELNAATGKAGIKYDYYIGSIQINIEDYQISYKHCLWLKDYKKSGNYFYDFVDDYMNGLIPRLEYYGIFNVFDQVLDLDFKSDYIQIMDTLYLNNFNLVTSSQKLHMHKNTLVFRLNKIRELLNLNPIRNADHRSFLKQLNYFFKVIQKNK